VPGCEFPDVRFDEKRPATARFPRQYGQKLEAPSARYAYRLPVRLERPGIDPHGKNPNPVGVDGRCGEGRLVEPGRYPYFVKLAANVHPRGGESVAGEDEATDPEGTRGDGLILIR